MSVQVYRVDARVSFRTENGMRERSGVCLFTAIDKSDAVDGAVRFARRYEKSQRDFPCDDESEHVLSSLVLGVKEICGIGSEGAAATTWPLLTVEPVRLDWKCDHPGSLDLHAEAAKR